MKIEAGRFYRTRDGRKASIIAPCGSGWVTGFIGKRDHQRDWQSDGSYLLGRESPKDLVAEWQDKPEDLERLEAT